MAATCEMHLNFERMSIYFEALHNGTLGEVGTEILEGLVKQWFQHECEAPCPAPVMCSFGTTSKTVDFYGWDSYFAVFAAVGEMLEQGFPLSEIPENPNSPRSDLMDQRHLRRPGHVRD